MTGALNQNSTIWFYPYRVAPALVESGYDRDWLALVREGKEKEGHPSQGRFGEL
jgi:hypothetical protein